MKAGDILKQSVVFDISSEGLDPLKHRICGISVKTSQEEHIFAERDEKTILERFWSYIEQNLARKIVGFNSDNFDIPMLIIRSMKHNVSIPDIKEKTIDLRKIIFKEIEKPKGKLSDFKELLGMEFPESGFKKMHMSILWEDKSILELNQYLLRDVKITWELYERLIGVGLL